MVQPTRGTCRKAPVSRTRSLPVLLTTLTVSAALAACSADSTGPSGPSEPANEAPVVQEIAVADDGYRKARLTGAVSDPENDIASVTIDWGDGKTTEVTEGFADISVQHRYDRAQDFTVTLTVVDGEGVTVDRSASISIQVPDPACLDFFKVIGACIEITRDLRNFNLDVKVLNKTVYKSEIKDGKGALRIPLAGGFGFLVIGFDMDIGKMTIGGEYCVIPHIKCEPLTSKTLEFQT